MTSSNSPSRSLYPRAYGTEQEMCVSITQDGNELNSTKDSSFLRYVPGNIQGYGGFMTNGFRIYQDKYQSEFSGPECETIQDAVLYNRVGEQLLVETSENYVTTFSAAEVAVRACLRVIDSAGNRWGVHDSYDVRTSYKDAVKDSTAAKNLLLGHLITRSVVTGAGLVTPEGLYYAQKIGGLVSEDTYGYIGSMYRFDNMNRAIRLETRVNDNNVSDWAKRIRIGSTALVIALGQTPYAKHIGGPTAKKVISLANQYNKLNISHEGTIASYKSTRRAIDFQQKIAEMAQDKLPKYTDDMPPELQQIADELYYYCEDFKRILDGDATIDILSNRADWAAKVNGILYSAARHSANGIPRSLTDSTAISQDFAYDMIRVTSSSEQGKREADVKYGWGFSLRDKGKLRATVSKDAVEEAKYCPPQGTRAAVRSHILKRYVVESSDWHFLRLPRPDGGIVEVVMGDVLENTMSEYKIRQLQAAKKK